MSSGCGCKEVYSFPHITYPYSSCIYLLFFAATSLHFVLFFFSFSFLFQYFFVIKMYVLKFVSRSINTHTGNYGRPTAAI